MQQQSLAFGRAGEKYAVYIRHIAALCHYVHIDKDLQLTISEPLDNLFVFLLSRADIVALNTVFAELLAQRYAVRNVHCEYQRLAVFLALFKICIHYQLVS